VVVVVAAAAAAVAATTAAAVVVVVVVGGGGGDGGCTVYGSERMETTMHARAFRALAILAAAGRNGQVVPVAVVGNITVVHRRVTGRQWW
jgi:hypothetical protein